MLPQMTDHGRTCLLFQCYWTLFLFSLSLIFSQKHAIPAVIFLPCVLFSSFSLPLHISYFPLIRKLLSHYQTIWRSFPFSNKATPSCTHCTFQLCLQLVMQCLTITILHLHTPICTFTNKYGIIHQQIWLSSWSGTPIKKQVKYKQAHLYVLSTPCLTLKSFPT